jgi:hypothetical protein
MMSSVVDCALAELRIDMPLAVSFERTDAGLAYPVFHPAE